MDLIEANKQFGIEEFGNNGNGPLIGYCSGDATDLDYIQDEVFDNILSIAAVLHLPNDKQCKLVLTQFLRIIKKGGKIIIGWNEYGFQMDMTMDKWEDCFRGYDGKYGEIDWEMINDQETLGYTLYDEKEVFSIFITKKN